MPGWVGNTNLLDEEGEDNNTVILGPRGAAAAGRGVRDRGRGGAAHRRAQPPGHPVQLRVRAARGRPQLPDQLRQRPRQHPGPGRARRRRRAATSTASTAARKARSGTSASTCRGSSIDGAARRSRPARARRSHMLDLERRRRPGSSLRPGGGDDGGVALAGVRRIGRRPRRSRRTCRRPAAAPAFTVTLTAAGVEPRGSSGARRLAGHLREPGQPVAPDDVGPASAAHGLPEINAVGTIDRGETKVTGMFTGREGLRVPRQPARRGHDPARR